MLSSYPELGSERQRDRSSVIANPPGPASRGAVDRTRDPVPDFVMNDPPPYVVHGETPEAIRHDDCRTAIVVIVLKNHAMPRIRCIFRERPGRLQRDFREVVAIGCG